MADKHTARAEIESAQRSLTPDKKATTTEAEGIPVAVNDQTDPRKLADSVMSRRGSRQE